ncbi:MAG: DUF3786 domain-containing protein [Firmicutes bacterium]|nr:DUF3786 domain-containing protein [Bacillota bacterium]
MNNHDAVLRQLVKKLARLNFGIVSNRTGVEFDTKTDSLKVRFLAEDYVITKSGCTPLSCTESDVRDRILILNYLLSFGGPDTGDGWLNFRDLPNAEAYDTIFRANVESVLERNVFDIVDCKELLMKKLDGHSAPGFQHASFGAVFPVLPRVELMVLLCEGDEELDPEAKVCFSSRATNFFSTEGLIAIAEALARKMVKISTEEAKARKKSA